MTYLGPCQTFLMEAFCENSYGLSYLLKQNCRWNLHVCLSMYDKPLTIFAKELHHGCLTDWWSIMLLIKLILAINYFCKKICIIDVWWGTSVYVQFQQVSQVTGQSSPSTPNPAKHLRWGLLWKKLTVFFTQNFLIRFKIVFSRNLFQSRYFCFFPMLKVAVRRCSTKEMFLKISQNWQKPLFW